MYAKLVNKKRTKSKACILFSFPADENGTILYPKKIICQLCKDDIPYSGNTTNLTYHLEHEHLYDYKKLFPDQGPSDDGKKAAASSSDTIKLKQVTLSAAIAKSAPYPRDSFKHKQLVEATIGFICHN